MEEINAVIGRVKDGVYGPSQAMDYYRALLTGEETLDDEEEEEEGEG